MTMLRYGVFENFKMAEIMLLISGSDGLAQLAALFRQMAVGECGMVKFGDLSWMRGEPECSVTLSLAAGDRSEFRLTRTGQAAAIHCELTRGDLIDFADKVDVLAAPECEGGHQYLDVLGEQPIEIMVSKDEYPNGWPVPMVRGYGTRSGH
jgi:hypothetical protein